jgi:hypothetical protein
MKLGIIIGLLFTSSFAYADNTIEDLQKEIIRLQKRVIELEKPFEAHLSILTESRADCENLIPQLADIKALTSGEYRKGNNTKPVYTADFWCTPYGNVDSQLTLKMMINR